MKLPMDKLTGRFQDCINKCILPRYENGRGYDYQRCADDLNELFASDATQENIISEDSVRKFFNNDTNFTQKNALWIMLGLLQIHNIPYDRVFPAVAGDNFLDDEGYFQTYHGVMYPRNSTLSEVEDLRFFTLDINPGEDFGPPSATLSYENKGDKNRKSIRRQFRGTPVVSPKNDIVSILFHDDNPRAGIFFHFYFAYHMVNATNLKFKRGFVITTLSDIQRSEIPVVLNFIMCNWPIDLTTVQNHPGLETLLQYANLSVYVPAEEFHAVLLRYPTVSYLFKPDNPLTAVTKEDLCVIDEPSILETIKSRVSSREHRLEAYRCLMELKKASRAPTRTTWEVLYDDLFGTITGIQ